MNVNGISGMIKPFPERVREQIALSNTAASKSRAVSCLHEYAASLRERSEEENRENLTRTQKLIREMNSRKPATDKDGNKIFTDTTIDKKSGFLQLKDTNESKQKKTESSGYHYNYLDIANRVRRAKTSVSAAQAVVAARRKVLEVKRQIASGNGDAGMLQLDLTHARRMEIAATRKKHHLELEELVDRTMKSDENRDRAEETAEDVKNVETCMNEEQLSGKEDEIFKDRMDMLDEFMEEYHKESGDEAVIRFNRMISEFGEDELERLEEEFFNLESMEVVNPHMDERQFEKLKTRHRNSEDKDLIKAEMDYLKGVFKHLQMMGSGSGASIQSVSSLSGFNVPSAVPVDAGTEPAVNVVV